MAWNKCYKCKWHTDKCKNQTSKNYNKFPDEVVKCNQPIKFIDKTGEGITKPVRKTRKDHKCYFCGHYIPAGSSCLVTIDFVEHNVKYSCDNCYHGIIALYGD